MLVYCNSNCIYYIIYVLLLNWPWINKIQTRRNITVSATQAEFPTQKSSCKRDEISPATYDAIVKPYRSRLSHVWMIVPHYVWPKPQSVRLQNGQNPRHDQYETFGRLDIIFYALLNKCTSDIWHIFIKKFIFFILS